MPDLFLGAAAGPPGLPDWIDHAFPDPIKNDPDYLATAVAALPAVSRHAAKAQAIADKEASQGFLSNPYSSLPLSHARINPFNAIER